MSGFVGMPITIDGATPIATSHIYASAGTFTETIPNNVTSVTAVCAAGCGGGGDGTTTDGGGGGGAGGLASASFNVYALGGPGKTFIVVVGTGGAPGAAGQVLHSGTGGGISRINAGSVSGFSNITCEPGGGGVAAASVGGAGGTGGTATNANSGGVVTVGGAGVNGTRAVGGAGGVTGGSVVSGDGLPNSGGAGANGSNGTATGGNIGVVAFGYS